MKQAPMRFKGFEWRHNPREISFKCERNVGELSFPFNGSKLSETGRKCLVIRGKGELFGEDCLEQFDRLVELFRDSGEGLLTLPGMKPFYAVFESVSVTGSPKPDVLGYSFVFRESPQKTRTTGHSFCVTRDGESLWDVSYRFGVPIDRLVELNPQIKRPDIVAKGSVIRLC